MSSYGYANSNVVLCDIVLLISKKASNLYKYRYMYMYFGWNSGLVCLHLQQFAITCVLGFMFKALQATVTVTSVVPQPTSAASTAAVFAQPLCGHCNTDYPKLGRVWMKWRLTTE